MTFRLKTSGNADGLPEGFFDVARRIYRDEPRWIPEDPAGLENRFSAENPWFAHGKTAAFCIPEKARLAMFKHPSAFVDGRAAAFFGYWETVGDDAADTFIFNAAQDWAREQGAEYLCGPINFSTYGTYRLLLEIEDGGYPFVGEPFNPQYYPEILRGFNFEPRSKALTQIAPAEVMSKVWRKRKPLVDELRSQGYRIEALEHQIWLNNLRELHELINEMFSDNFGYTPLSFAAFEQMCNASFIRRIDPRTSVIAYAPDDSIAGFFLLVPQYGPLIVQGAKDDRVAVGDLSFDQHFPRLRERGDVGGIFKTGAVAPAHREKGIFSALTITTFELGEGIYDSWYGALIRADNPSRRYADGYADDSRRYALFGKELNH